MQAHLDAVRLKEGVELLSLEERLLKAVPKSIPANPHRQYRLRSPESGETLPWSAGPVDSAALIEST